MTVARKPAGADEKAKEAEAQSADAIAAAEQLAADAAAAEEAKAADAELADAPASDAPEDGAPAASSEPEPDDEPQLYRAVQTLYGPSGLIAPGDLFVARPSSGLARSQFSVAVDDGEPVPAEVAAALEAALAD